MNPRPQAYLLISSYHCDKVVDLVKVQIIYGTCKKRGQVLPAIMLSPSGYCEQCLRKLQHERASEEEEGTMDLLAESEVMESEEDLVDEEH